jgi:hypothetical protein
VAIFDPSTIPPDLVEDIAAGIHDPVEVAARYGLKYQDFLELSAEPWLIDMVATTKAQLQRAGFTFKTKVEGMLSLVTNRLYSQAMGTTDVTKLAQAVKVLGDLLKGEKDKTDVGGPKYSLRITFSSGAQTTIEGTAQDVDLVGPAPDPIEDDDVEDLLASNRPEPLKIPDFGAAPNSDLSNGFSLRIRASSGAPA